MKARGKRKAQEVNREQTGTPPPRKQPSGPDSVGLPSEPVGRGFLAGGAPVWTLAHLSPPPEGTGAFCLV